MRTGREMGMAMACLLVLAASGCEGEQGDPATDPRETAATPADPPAAGAESAPRLSQPELRAAPGAEPVERAWLQPGRRIEVDGVTYVTDELVMTFHESDVVEHGTHDGVVLYRPAWSEPPPDVLLVRQSEWLWTTLRRAL